MRYTVAFFSLPLVTANGRVRSVDNPRGNALKYLLLSNELIEATAKFCFQIRTCFRISFANIRCYLRDRWIDRCFNGVRMALHRLFETFFDLRGKVRVEGGQRNMFIARNPKTSANLTILQQNRDLKRYD